MKDPWVQQRLGTTGLNTTTSYLSLNLWGLLLCLFELVPQGEDLPDASIPAARCHGLPIKWDILLDGGIHQATVFRLGHGHVALCHDLIWAAPHLLPLCALSCVFLLQWQVDTGAGRKRSDGKEYNILYICESSENDLRMGWKTSMIKGWKWLLCQSMW